MDTDQKGVLNMLNLRGLPNRKHEWVNGENGQEDGWSERDKGGRDRRRRREGDRGPSPKLSSRVDSSCITKFFSVFHY